MSEPVRRALALSARMATGLVSAPIDARLENVIPDRERGVPVHDRKARWRCQILLHGAPWQLAQWKSHGGNRTVEIAQWKSDRTPQIRVHYAELA